MMLKTMMTAPEYVARATEWGLRSDKTAVADAYYELLVTDLRPGLGKIASPALVMGSWAGMKQFATREQIEETFRKQYAGLADVRVVLSENGKHFLMYDDPAWMFGEMEAFLTPKAVSSK
jgi:pimeloyl-ACP methyl ester carboxylesterase